MRLPAARDLPLLSAPAMPAADPLPAPPAQTLTWAAGLISAVIGAMILVVPHQFASPVYDALRPHLSWWGLTFLLSGMGLMSVPVFRPMPLLRIGAHLLVGGLWVLVAWGLARVGGWTGCASWAPYGLGVAIAPFIVPQRTARWVQQGLLSLLSGLVGLIMGLVIILLGLAGQITPQLYGGSHRLLPLLAPLFLVSGCLLLFAHLYPKSTPAVLRRAQLFGALTFLTYALLIPLPTHAWTGTALYLGLSVGLAWDAALARRVAGLGLATFAVRLAAVLVGVTTLGFISLVLIVDRIELRGLSDEEIPGLAAGREVTFVFLLATVMLTAVVAVLVAHWLTRPMISLTRAIDGLAAGDSTIPLPAASVAEVAHVTAAFGEMRERLAQRSAELQALAEKYENIVETASEGIWMAALDGTTLLVNQRMAELLGYTRDELLAAKATDFLADAGEQAVAYQGRATLSQGHRIQSELKFRRKDGSLLWTIVNASPLLDKEGQQIGSLVLHTDITERKRTEEALRESEERYRSLFESLSSAAVLAEPILDGDGKLVDLKYLMANPAVSKHLMRRPEELVGRKYSDVVNYPGRNPVLDTYEQVFVTGEPYQGEMLLPALGRHYDIAVSRPSAGRLAIVLSDITERKQAEQALANAERRYRELLRNAPTGIYEIDFRSGRLTSVNEAMCDLSGYSRAELLSQNALDLLDGESQLRFKARIGQWLRGVKPEKDVEYRVKRKDGRLIDVVLNVTFTVDENGKPLGAEVVGHDITERKQAEAEKERLLVAMRQREVELAAANKELESFSYTVSHDLRAPLRAIDGFTQFLQDDYSDSLDAEGQRYLKNVRTNVHYMGQLVDDLLAFARLGRQELRAEPVDMKALAQAVLRELQSQNPNRQITVTLGDLPACFGDAALLRQVWVNLLSNAFKFTAHCGVAQVEIGCSAAAGETVYSVRDNGVGFDMQYAGKLFGVFQRLHRQDEFEGAGVGLAIVKRVVERHGGRVWAEAALGQGATFSFTLG